MGGVRLIDAAKSVLLQHACMYVCMYGCIISKRGPRLGGIGEFLPLEKRSCLLSILLSPKKDTKRGVEVCCVMSAVKPYNSHAFQQKGTFFKLKRASFKGQEMAFSLKV